MESAPIMDERPDNPLLRCRALLRGRGLFAARVDIVQPGSNTSGGMWSSSVAWAPNQRMWEAR